ncbi:MAG: 50S ribosomal protein L29 [Desulfobacterales bacterium]|jgi:large subunit ribosomal protein L29|nr:50S ribosomal protein L29 [Desulfobacterales bacterium]MDD3081046.1 50S ribosomal protein L29 [Desulfobacterales bacterium]MDD3950513.1 50S ribosomal protein L29 [Desulfobacterales bacterium]MDD4463542.1 50S ribosomal protein L29 [Desulfobacterales bacterium]MDY0376884.1 50S ribosomal protein L29 [Desulfobacterales bacterium]
MKIGEIRSLSADERLAKVKELKESLFNLRFQHGTGQLENTRKLVETKHDIARLKTVIREFELNKTDKE